MVIEVHKLVKRFGVKTVLRGLDFQVDEGEFVAILGPNGAGKTTFLRILASLSRPGAGRCAHCRLPPARHARTCPPRLGVVSHLPLLYGDLTAEENLRFFGKMYSVPDLSQRISRGAGAGRVGARRRDLVRTFSRGMQQRLAIGRAVLHDPEVMLFDEPYTGLDQDACIHAGCGLARRGRGRADGGDDFARPGARRLTWPRASMCSRAA